MATTTTILSRAWPELHPARRPVHRCAAVRHQRSNQWTARSGSSPTRQRARANGLPRRLRPLTGVADLAMGAPPRASSGGQPPDGHRPPGRAVESISSAF
ncbi:proline-rich receptor-like protein kinase PERK12 [Iris pallida]|uniref:Proline-rich receptor-like protein kinase PERK12 n=1 Tax=Iris pallida TaxID=29817 RepID=A0AAX6EAS9_IRIPA|nr:proline-rich receptor-like protein kinase PERK12 [Iris pallida]